MDTIKDMINMISTKAHRITAVLIAALAVLICMVLAWFGLSTYQRITHINQNWVAYNQQSAAAGYHLSQIESRLGYGGFIHHYKNYVLRQGDSRVPQIDADLRALDHYIAQYQALNIGDRERAALQQVKTTIDEYAEQFQLAQQLARAGHTAKVIDDRVRVDDRAALKAIKTLVDETQNQRLRKQQETQAALDETYYFLAWGLLIIPLVLVAAGVMIVFLRHLVETHARMEETQLYLNGVLNAAPDTMLIVSSEGRVLRCNDEAEQLFGYSREELQTLNVEDLLPAHYREGHAALRTEAVKHPHQRPMMANNELYLENKAGQVVPVAISLNYFQYQGKTEIIAAVRDVSEQRRAQEQLRLADKVLKTTGEPILITNANHRIIDMNDAYCALTGYSREELLGRDPFMMRSGHHDKAFYDEMWQTMKREGHWQGEIWNRGKDGLTYTSLVTLSSVRDESDKISHYVGVYSDITKLKQAEERLEKLAHFDHLTGLANRMLLQDRLRSSVARAQRHKGVLAVLYIDLDGFKAVNDNLGHQAGDAILIEVAELMQRCVRDDDTVARLGGDEFAIILNDVEDVAAVRMVLDRLVKDVMVSKTHGQQTLDISCSIGVALYPDDGKNADTLLVAADTAMYYAKKRGKHGYQFCNAIPKLVVKDMQQKSLTKA